MNAFGFCRYFPFLARACSSRRAEVELEFRNLTGGSIHRRSMELRRSSQNSSEITDARYGTGVRQTHTCTFRRIYIYIYTCVQSWPRSRREPSCDPRPVSSKTRSRTSYTTLTGVSIDRGLPAPRGESLFCRAIAPIRRESALSGIKVEKDSNGFSLSFDSRLNLDPLSLSFRLLSPNFCLSHIDWRYSFSTGNFIGVYLVLLISRVNIYIRQRIFLFATCVWKESANFIPFVLLHFTTEWIWIS